MVPTLNLLDPCFAVILLLTTSSEITKSYVFQNGPNLIGCHSPRWICAVLADARFATRLSIFYPKAFSEIAALPRLHHGSIRAPYPKIMESRQQADVHQALHGQNSHVHPAAGLLHGQKSSKILAFELTISPSSWALGKIK